MKKFSSVLSLLFVNKHPWAKDVGLVLNFEARGSGGSSYDFIEANRGNQNLLREFIEAHPVYPMANSLYYSIYKILSNDTDLTVFRENRDIDGFNFAFIDDHYDYHTAHYISDKDITELRLTIPKTERRAFTFYEASKDLLQHPHFEVPQRPANSIPMRLC